MTLPRQADVHEPLLAVLAEQFGGEARPKDVYEPLAKRFPAITLDDLSAHVPSGANRWTTIVRFARWDLVEGGFIEPEPQGIWRLTAAGRQRASGRLESLPIAVSEPPPAVRDGLFAEAKPRPELMALTSIEAALLAAERAATRPSEFEAAAASAFAFLGFDVEQLGGAGDTDVMIDAPLGIDRYSLILDAKTTAKGAVAEAQINWLALDDHREKHHADYAVVLGPTFAGGALTQHAHDRSVTLLTTSRLIALLRLHDSTPLTLTELRPFFVGRGDDLAFDALSIACDKMRRATSLLMRIVEQVRDWNEVQPNQVLAHPTTLFATLLQGQAGLDGLTRDEVIDAVAVLSSTTVGILHPTGDGYVSTTTPSGAAQRLAALATGAGSLRTSE